MSRQAAHDQRIREAGGKRITVTLQPATVAALRELRARGAVSDAAAVNAAVIAAAGVALGGRAKDLSIQALSSTVAMKHLGGDR